MKRFILTISCALVLAVAQSATVNWGAAVDTGIVDSTGNNLLPTGDLIRLGYFTITDSQILALASPTASNLATLSSNWHSIADTTIGTGTFSPGSFQVASTPNLTAADFGHQIYIWALNATTVSASTQQAIFYNPIANSGAWALPGSNLNSTSIDIGGTTGPKSGGTYLAGSYQTTNAAAAGVFGAGAGAVKLAAVPAPEPSTITLCAMAAVAMAGSRRRARAGSPLIK